MSDSTPVDEAIVAFLAAVQAQDCAGAREVLRLEPRIATESLHVAAVLGLADVAERLINEDRARVASRVGDPAGDPLLFLCYSPFHGEDSARDAALLATARVLLDAGADPSTRDGLYGLPALYAVTGVRSVVPIARLLLAAGANPDDGESLHHAAEHFHEEALQLLVDAGADLNAVGDWGNTPLHFLLRWFDVECDARVKQGLDWLLAHGATPDVICAEERETALHVTARRGQGVAVVQRLLDHGADVHARRADGHTAWFLAQRGGFDEIAALLEARGAETEALAPVDLLLAACGRGDVEGAREQSSPEILAALSSADHLLLVEAAAAGRGATVAACLAAGFPVDVQDASGATALHHGAFRGQAAVVRHLLKAGAKTALRDRQHDSTPMGWVCFGADHLCAGDADHESCVRALLEAGARLGADEYHPAHDGVRRVVREFVAS